ncbi:hypothetical protein ABIB35_003535 [Arthrobacter sp. UYP6]|uniref:CU044_5270 family protein n=1 Tax=Arthrobacter sp. UYP6 TaxID=1756378 RepID=UPI0033950AFD
MDELHLLRATRNTTGTVPPQTLAAGREKLIRKAAAEEAANEAPATNVLRPRRPWRRTLLTITAAAAIATGLVVVDVVGSGERPGATAEATQVLSDAAVATITTSDPVVAPGQYLLIDTKAVFGTTNVTAAGEEFFWLNGQDGQVYVPADRNAEWIWSRDPIAPEQFFDEASRQEAEGREPLEPGDPGGAELLRAPGGRFYGSPQYILFDIPLDEAVESAPRDARQLLDLIYERSKGAGNSPDEEAFVTIADTLRTGVIPADLRAALYQSAALIPGVTVVDREATLDGRSGIALGMKAKGRSSRIEIIIDQQTGLVIGEREMLLEGRGSIPAGTAIGWTAVTTTVVDTAP